MRSDKDSVDRAVKLLRDSGIGSIEDLGRKAADEALRTGSSVEEVLGGRTVIPDQAPPMRWRADKQEGPFRHAPIEVPLLLDDAQELEPGSLSRLDGVAVDYVWDDAAASSGVLRGFTNSQAAYEYMRAQPVLKEPPPGSPSKEGDRSSSFHVGGVRADFYEHINRGGATFRLDLGHAWPDLTRLTMSGWWFWAVSWNDQISSVWGGSGWVTLWEHIYPPVFGLPPGSKLHISPFAIVNLTTLGWNDRVSAIDHNSFQF